MFFIGASFLCGENAVASVPTNVDDITYISVTNAEYDNVYLTNDIDADPHDDTPTEWDIETVLYAPFDSTTNAGNITYFTESIDNILIKRREVNSLQWTTIYAKAISTDNRDSDLVINNVDVTAAAKREYEYALVPTYQGIEGVYNIATVTSDFDGIYISEVDPDTYDHTVYGTVIGTGCDITRNQPCSVTALINNKYPKCISNSIVNYDTLTCTGQFVQFIGCDTDGAVGEFDFTNGWRYRKALMDFLTDRKPKILKYRTGEIWLVNVTNNPTANEVEGLSDLREISFECTEVGNPDSDSDLYYAGLSNVGPTWWKNG